MVEWKELGQLGKFENIGTDKKINEGEHLVTLLNYVDVYHHKFIDSSVPQMRVSASDKKIEACTVEQGDIFVTPSSETVDDIGHSSVITETIPNAVYSYHIMRYRLFKKDMLLSYYINYAFDTENVKKQILKKAQGLTRFGLSKNKFASILIPLPSLSEQTRIVGILDTFTAAIENLKQQIAERRKQYEYYRDELLDLEGKDGVELKTIEEMGDFFGGLTGKTKEDFIDGNAKFITYMNVFSNPSLISSVVGSVKISKGEKQNKVQMGDILFTGSSETPDEVGMSCVVTEELDDDYYMNSFCFGLRLYEHSKYNLNYLKHVFRSGAIRKKIARTASGVTRFNISKARFKTIEIPIPSIEEQSRIVSILDTFEASIANLEAQLKEREKQYEYYRNKLLTFE